MTIENHVGCDVCCDGFCRLGFISGVSSVCNLCIVVPTAQGTKNLVAAAKRAGVSKFVLVTVLGAEEPINPVNLFGGVSGRAVG